MARTKRIDYVAFCRAMGDETRQQILQLLQQEGELPVGELSRRLKSPQPTVSHHLKILKQEELVLSRRAGKEIFYSLNGENVMECCGQLFARFVPASSLKQYLKES